MAKPSFGNKKHGDPKGHREATNPIHIKIILVCRPVFTPYWGGAPTPPLGAAACSACTHKRGAALNLDQIGIKIVGLGSQLKCFVGSIDILLSYPLQLPNPTQIVAAPRGG